MTCIVGLVHQHIVYMGGDSAASNDYQVTLLNEQKVFHNRGFLLGSAGSMRMRQLLQHAFVPPRYEGKEALETYLATRFVDAVRDCFERGDLREKELRKVHSCFLVGIAGRLFEVASNYQIQESRDEYHAIGNGDDVALGVLYATRGLKMSPQARVTCALEAAAHHIKSVRAPFCLESEDIMNKQSAQ